MLFPGYTLKPGHWSAQPGANDHSSINICSSCMGLSTLQAPCWLCALLNHHSTFVEARPSGRVAAGQSLQGCMQAGARKVYAVEASAMADFAKLLASANAGKREPPGQSRLLASVSLWQPSAMLSISCVISLARQQRFPCQQFIGYTAARPMRCLLSLADALEAPLNVCMPSANSQWPESESHLRSPCRTEKMSHQE